MDRNKAKAGRRTRRKAGIRKRVAGAPDAPRLCVHRSLQHTYAQLIDDLDGRTLAAASTRDSALGLTGAGGNIAAAQAVGKAIAQKGKAAGVSRVVFDRNGFRYHGRIKALADAAREGGLTF